ncbi:hypothetical protein [Arthrobacter sp. efr-133-TYG-118]|nr:hypothetical protein [Arthrobacter sp. efr-133-TYG-118]
MAGPVLSIVAPALTFLFGITYLSAVAGKVPATGFLSPAGRLARHRLSR